MFITDRLLSVYDQIIIYGAKGWIGQSAVSILLNQNSNLPRDKILLIGSKSEQFNNSNKLLDIYSVADSIKFVDKNCLFLNAAYLRREKIKTMSRDEYIQKNYEISEFGKKLLEKNKIKTFINLSSGVASEKLYKFTNITDDLYAKSKISDEIKFQSACDSVSAFFINCRIYSVSGKFINEFENLALSLFIQQAFKKPNVINVKSPKTLRTYVNAVDLVRVLFELSLNKKNYTIDSGGYLIQLGQLADKISSITQIASVDKSSNLVKSADYYGDFKIFNELAKQCGIKLLNIEDQIIETMIAFNK
jgi:nucleoside-diphosphate-sugar epimerase